MGVNVTFWEIGFIKKCMFFVCQVVSFMTAAAWTGVLFAQFGVPGEFGEPEGAETGSMEVPVWAKVDQLCLSLPASATGSHVYKVNANAAYSMHVDDLEEFSWKFDYRLTVAAGDEVDLNGDGSVDLPVKYSGSLTLAPGNDYSVSFTTDGTGTSLIDESDAQNYTADASIFGRAVGGAPFVIVGNAESVSVPSGCALPACACDDAGDDSGLELE